MRKGKEWRRQRGKGRSKKEGKEDETNQVREVNGKGRTKLKVKRKEGGRGEKCRKGNKCRKEWGMKPKGNFGWDEGR